MYCEKNLKPAQKRTLIEDLIESYRVSKRRACGVIQICRMSFCYQSIRDEQAPLRMKIKEMEAVRVRYGYKRIYILLRREGWLVNHKRVYRLYCQEGLNLRTKRPWRRVNAAHRIGRPPVTKVYESWSMDIISDSLFRGTSRSTKSDFTTFGRHSFGVRVNLYGIHRTYFFAQHTTNTLTQIYHYGTIIP